MILNTSPTRILEYLLKLPPFDNIASPIATEQEENTDIIVSVAIPALPILFKSNANPFLKKNQFFSREISGEGAGNGRSWQETGRFLQRKNTECKTFCELPENFFGQKFVISTHGKEMTIPPTINQLNRGLPIAISISPGNSVSQSVLIGETDKV